jgi:ubiquitin-conjugating enzyme E2 J2
MAADLSTRRLRKELISLKKKPVPNIQATPLESNILEWHYVIEGTKGTPYEGGHYHGKLKFPPEYPLKPPAVMMFTPNGRFKTGRRLCLSMSDFHPETWNPMWSVSSILMGLYSFMLDSAPTLGSMEATTAARRKMAAQSLEYNCKDSTFRKLFPEFVELNEERMKERALQPKQDVDSSSDSKAPARPTNQDEDIIASPSPMVFLFGAAIAVAGLAYLLS